MRTVMRAGMWLVPVVAISAGGAWAAPAALPEAGAPAPSPSAAAAGQSGDRASAESSLALGEDMAGEVVVRDAEGLVVAHVRKHAGRELVVPLDPGKYEIECVTEPQLLHAAVSVAEGERVVVGRNRLEPREGRPRRSFLGLKRARHERPRDERPNYEPRLWRLSMDMGGWADGHGQPSVVITDDRLESHNGGLLGGMSFGYRLSPEWMVTIGVNSRLIDASDSDWLDGERFDRASMLTTFALGARYYLPPLAARSGIKPYVSAGIGPTFGMETEDREWRDADHDHHHHDDTLRSEGVFGGYVGAGMDLHPSRWLVMGADVTYYASPRLSEAVGGRRDTSGFAFTFQMGMNFGRLHAAARK